MNGWFVQRWEAMQEAHAAEVRYLKARAQRDAAEVRTREALAEWSRLETRLSFTEKGEI